MHTIIIIISKHISKLELLTSKKADDVCAFESKARMKTFPVLFHVHDDYRCWLHTFIMQIQSSWWHFPVLIPAYDKCPMTNIFTGPLQFSRAILSDSVAFPWNLLLISNMFTWNLRFKIIMSWFGPAVGLVDERHRFDSQFRTSFLFKDWLWTLSLTVPWQWTKH